MNHSYRRHTDERPGSANYARLHRAHAAACGSKQARLQSAQLRATYERQHRKTRGKEGQNTTRRGAPLPEEAGVHRDGHRQRAGQGPALGWAVGSVGSLLLSLMPCMHLPYLSNTT